MMAPLAPFSPSLWFSFFFLSYLLFGAIPTVHRFIPIDNGATFVVSSPRFVLTPGPTWHHLWPNFWWPWLHL